MLEVVVTAPVKPSEDAAKVEAAVRALWPDARLERTASAIVAGSASLQSLRERIWKQRILDAARRMLLGSLAPDGRHAMFELNKQAAFVGRVSFAVADAPLGNIMVEVRGEGLEAAFKAIAPPTLRGRPVSEEEYERHLERERRRRGLARRTALPATAQEDA